MSDFTATYSPEDNKLRLYAVHCLDPETYERVKAEGFRWAPRQELFVAPAWTPAREDLLTELCGEIGDEDTSLADRAEERADRFDEYHEKRGAEAEQARQAVDAIADGIPLGQPILVGHHSQKHAERDARRIESGMRKAVNLWKTSQYWTGRAHGVRRHANYKHNPGVIARRIKKLEAERRKCQREVDSAAVTLKLWRAMDKPHDGAPATTEKIHARALWIANHRSGGSYTFPLSEYPRAEPASQYEGRMSMWSALEDGIVNAEQARDRELAHLGGLSPHYVRWTDHLTLRIGYERALLGDETPAAEDTPRAKRTAPKLPPILNIDGAGFHKMTKAEWAAKHRDYKGTRTAEDGSHRYRVAMYKKPGTYGLTSGPVFITDKKAHPAPQAPKPDTPEPQADEAGQFALC